MTNFPTSLDDSTSLPNPTATSKTNSPSHSNLHTSENDAIKAVEAKIGTGSSTPTSGRLLRGNGTGTSAWAQLAMSTDVAAFTSSDLRGVVSDETGTGSLVFGTSPTIVTPTIASFASANHDHSNSAGGGQLVGTSALTTGSVDHTLVAAGFCVQQAGNMVSAVNTGTTVMPFDDTIPQNTEGVEFITQAITPKSATNILVIEATLSLAHTSAAGYLSVALFQDTTANALAAISGWYDVANSSDYRVIRHRMVAGTTSSTTFKIRAGNSSAGTVTLNGTAGSRMMGGVMASSLVIREYKAA